MPGIAGGMLGFTSSSQQLGHADAARGCDTWPGLAGECQQVKYLWRKNHAPKVVLPSQKSEICWFMLNSMLGSMGTHNPPVDVEDLMSIICMFVT